MAGIPVKVRSKSMPSIERCVSDLPIYSLINLYVMTQRKSELTRGYITIDETEFKEIIEPKCIYLDLFYISGDPETGTKDMPCTVAKLYSSICQSPSDGKLISVSFYLLYDGRLFREYGIDQILEIVAALRSELSKNHKPFVKNYN